MRVRARSGSPNIHEIIGTTIDSGETATKDFAVKILENVFSSVKTTDDSLGWTLGFPNFHCK